MKRYLLLNSYNTLEIVDTNEYIKGTLGNLVMFYKEKKHKDIVLKSNCIIIDNHEISLIKESDELLDLIEPGDILEITGYYGIDSIKREFFGIKNGRYIIEGCSLFCKSDLENDILLKIFKQNKNTKKFDLSWERKSKTKEEEK